MMIVDFSNGTIFGLTHDQTIAYVAYGMMLGEMMYLIYRASIKKGIVSCIQYFVLSYIVIHLYQVYNGGIVNIIYVCYLTSMILAYRIGIYWDQDIGDASFKDIWNETNEDNQISQIILEDSKTKLKSKEN